jgi:hypothetical protein
MVANLLRINNNILSAIFSWPSTSIYLIRGLSVQNRSDLLVVIDLLKNYPIIGDVVQSQWRSLLLRLGSYGLLKRAL